MVESVERKEIQEKLIASLLNGQQQDFFFPERILGFSSSRRFTLSRYQPEDGSESPFFLLQSTENALSFPLVSPRLLIPEYRLSPPTETLIKLATDTMDDLVVLAIITLRERLDEITANLQGPLLLNPVARLGLQFVAEHYPVRCALIHQQHQSAPKKKARRVSAKK